MPNMKESTIYLVYNTKASDVKLNHSFQLENDKQIDNQMYEYMDEDEFTITYSPDDERKYTDIKILSKTKLKDRPKSAGELLKKPKGSVEGIFIRRASSLSTIERGLVALKRKPLIRPLLSETEILQIQQLQEECRRVKFENDTKELLTRELSRRDKSTQLIFDNKSFKHDSIKYNTDGFRNFKPNELKDKRILSTTPLDSIGDQSEIQNKKKPSVGKTGKSPQRKYEPTAFDKTLQSRPTSAAKSQKGNLKKTPNVGNQLKDYRPTKTVEHRSKKTVENRPTKTVENRPTKTVGHRSKSEKKSTAGKPKTSITGTTDHKGDKQKDKASKSQKKKQSLTGQNKYKDTNSETSNPNQKEGMKNDVKRKNFSNANEGKTKSKSKNELDTGKSEIQLSVESTKYSKNNLRSTNETASKKKQSKQKNSDRIKTAEVNKETISLTAKSEKSNKSKKIKETDERSSDDDIAQKSVHEGNVKEKNGIGSLKGKRKSPKDRTPRRSSAGSVFGKITSQHPISNSTSDKRQSGDKQKHKPDTAASNEKKIKDKMTARKSKKYSEIVQYMIKYVLSNPDFIKLGWTILPNDPFKTRVVTFKALAANPESYFLRSRHETEVKFYQSGNLALKMSEDGSGRLNYPSGWPALIVTKNEWGTILTLFSDPKRDPLVKESFQPIVLGMFDCFGNGVVYDYSGNKVLFFNQMEGLYSNKNRGISYSWKWGLYKILETKRLNALLNSLVNEIKQPPPATHVGKKIRTIVRGDSVGSQKNSDTEKKSDMDRMYEALLAELPRPVSPGVKVREKVPKTGFKPIVLKINTEITLRINGHDKIFLYFSAGRFNYKIDLGVRIDTECIERIDEVGANKKDTLSGLFDTLVNVQSKA